MRSRQKEISDEALAELISRVGPNARQLDSEIEKLSLYVGDRSLLAELIGPVASRDSLLTGVLPGIRDGIFVRIVGRPDSSRAMR